jgi:hypothetical protein
MIKADRKARACCKWMHAKCCLILPVSYIAGQFFGTAVVNSIHNNFRLIHSGYIVRCFFYYFIIWCIKLSNFKTFSMYPSQLMKIICVYVYVSCFCLVDPQRYFNSAYVHVCIMP